MNGVWLCNTQNHVSEPTADMAMWLTLAVILDTPGADNSDSAGLCKNGRVLSDLSGLKLGIIGMGVFGKV